MQTKLKNNLDGEDLKQFSLYTDEFFTDVPFMHVVL